MIWYIQLTKTDKLFSMRENELSYLIRGAIFKVYNALGPGLLETIYEQVLAFELRELDLDIKTQVSLPFRYGPVTFESGFRLDILVEDSVVIEVKSVETLWDVHHKQLLTYLKLSDLRLGILVNFNTADISKSIFRKVNGL
jgi:GxxExxY protein